MWAGAWCGRCEVRCSLICQAFMFYGVYSALCLSARKLYQTYNHRPQHRARGCPLGRRREGAAAVAKWVSVLIAVRRSDIQGRGGMTGQRDGEAVGCEGGKWEGALSFVWFSQAFIAAERLARGMRYTLARRATLPGPGSAVVALGC